MTSRRKAELVKGRVKVTAKWSKLGTQVVNKILLRVDGVPIYQEEYGYYLFYKPRGLFLRCLTIKAVKVVTDYFTDVMSEFIQSVVWIMILLVYF